MRPHIETEMVLKHPFGSLGLAWLACALVLSGCSLEDVDSDAIRTQGMFADMLALAPGDGTTFVRVRLTVGGASGTNITLVNDDRLEATFREVTAVLDRTGDGRYEAQLEGDAAGEVGVWLTRGPDDLPAGGSALLPEPFITQLVTDASVGIDRASEVVVSWAPAVPGGVVRWEVGGRCLWTRSGATPDDGSLTLGPESFEVRGTRAGEECEVTITLDRANVHDVDPLWIPGSAFEAIQRRAVRFVSTPAPSEGAALELDDDDAAGSLPAPD